MELPGSKFLGDAMNVRIRNWSPADTYNIQQGQLTGLSSEIGQVQADEYFRAVVKEAVEKAIRSKKPIKNLGFSSAVNSVVSAVLMQNPEDFETFVDDFDLEQPNESKGYLPSLLVSTIIIYYRLLPL